MISAEINQKARELCLQAEIRPYCKKIHFFIYDLDNPREDGDCDDAKEFILQDAVAALLTLGDKFKDAPIIDSKFVRQISYHKKTIKLTKKDGGKMLIECKPESLHYAGWEYTKQLMASR